MIQEFTIFCDEYRKEIKVTASMGEVIITLINDKADYSKSGSTEIKEETTMTIKKSDSVKLLLALQKVNF